MCFVNGKYQLIYADTSCPDGIGIYSQKSRSLYNLSGNQALKPDCLGKYKKQYILTTHKKCKPIRQHRILLKKIAITMFNGLKKNSVEHGNYDICS